MCLKEAKEMGKTMYENLVRQNSKVLKTITDKIERSTKNVFSKIMPANFSKGPSKLRTAKAKAVLVTKLYF